MELTHSPSGPISEMPSSKLLLPEITPPSDAVYAVPRDCSYLAQLVGACFISTELSIKVLRGLVLEVTPKCNDVIATTITSTTITRLKAADIHRPKQGKSGPMIPAGLRLFGQLSSRTFTRPASASSVLRASTFASRPRFPRIPPAKPFSTGSSQSAQYQYSRFNNARASRNYFARWAARPTFYYEVGGVALVAGGVYTYNLETVPVSGRRRFNVVTPEQEARQAAQMKASILEEYRGRVLPENDRRVQSVRRVLARLLPAAGVQDARHEGWEVYVIDDPKETNAFVIPGGKVFVFTGILPVCANDDGVAAVLGHEIAHNLAHHAAERMSQSFIFVGLLYLAAFFVGLPDSLSAPVLDLVFMKPGSRSQESEADFIGLQLMAQSCYDPATAVDFWRRMEKATASKGAPPQFLSTHPSNHNRIEKITEWLPAAQDRYAQADCTQRTLPQMNAFRQTYRDPVSLGLQRWS